MARIPDAGERAIPRDRSQVVNIDTSMVGRGLREVGAAAQDFVMEKAQEDDEIAVNEFRRKLNDWEYNNVYDLEKGAASKRGKDALDLGQVLPQEYDKFIEAEAGGSYSSRARQAIAGIALSRREQLQEWTNKHVGQQRELYLDTEHATNNESAIQRAGALASNPAVVGAELEALRLRSTEHYKRKLGITADPVVIQGLVRKEEENFHNGVVSNLLSMDKINEATDYFLRNNKFMGLDDVIRHRQNIDTARGKRDVLAGVDDIINTAGPDALSSTAPTSTIEDVVLTLESNGQRWDPRTGGILTSSKGAQGEMQVMPDTARDPGYGVLPAQNDSPEELARVGRDYILAMVREYQGDTKKALAAYNAGPGAVGQALMQARQRGTTDWLQFMPEETREYVASGEKMMAKVQRKPRLMSMADYEPMLRARFSDPEQLANARQELAFRLQTRDQDIKIKREEAMDEALTLIENGTQFSALPQDLMARVDPSNFGNLRDHSKKVNSGLAPDTDWEFYHDVVTDPNKLKNTNLKANRYRLGEQEFKELVRAQGNLESSKEWNNLLTRKEVLEGMMNSSGINTETAEGKKQLAKFLHAMSQRVDQTATEQELRAAAARMLVDVKIERPIFNRSTKLYDVGDDEYERVIVPRENRARLIDALRRNGEPVTEESIRTYYLMGLNQ